MASATQKIQEIINLLDRKIVYLEKRNEINVSMRIDEVIPFLKEVDAIAKDDITTRKFDITATVSTGCSLAYTINGESASAGSNVLTYGDKLVITATASTGYDITSLKVNGQDYVSGTEITVTTDIAVIATTALETYNLVVTQGDNTTVSVTKGGVAIEAGTGVISYGDVLTITATAGTGYTLSTLTVNASDFISGQTTTVSGNVTIVSSATANTYDLTVTQGTNTTITITSGGESVSAGTGAISYGQVLTITGVADEGYTLSTFTVNGETFTSGDTFTVAGNVTVVSAATQN